MINFCITQISPIKNTKIHSLVLGRKIRNKKTCILQKMNDYILAPIECNKFQLVFWYQYRTEQYAVHTDVIMDKAHIRIILEYQLLYT